MDKNVTFLTNKKIDGKRIINILKENSHYLKNSEDDEILKKILSDFEGGNFSLLSPQEVQFLDIHDVKVWSDYLVYRHKFFEYPKKRIVSEFPIYLLIEPVSACNIRCVMCFQIDKTFTSDQKFMGNMDLNLFKKIIDQAVEGGTKAITLASRGEPTLHPQLDQMVDYCSGKFFELKLNTNATRLNEKLIHKLLQSEMTDMVFSIDSYQKEEYESIRKGGIFEEVLNNIKKFQEIKNDFYPNSKCSTRVSGVKINEKQNLKLFKNFWEKYVDHVVMVEMENRWDTYNNPTEIAGKGACQYLWERMYIWYDGICNPCDVDYKSELALGSIQDNSIHDIWHGEKFTALREAHLNSRRNSCFPCDRCPVGN